MASVVDDILSDGRAWCERTFWEFDTVWGVCGLWGYDWVIVDVAYHGDILCNTDHWQVGNYNQRPLMICGYIDGMLNKQKLSGIGTLQFFTCGELILDNQLSGYTLSYKAIHGTDDILEKGQNLDDLNIPTIPFKEWYSW